MGTLGDDYPKEQARLRELLEAYKNIGPAGAFGYVMIKAVLERADRAALNGDLVEMLAAYKAMQGCE